MLTKFSMRTNFQRGNVRLFLKFNCVLELLLLRYYLRAPVQWGWTYI